MGEITRRTFLATTGAVLTTMGAPAGRAAAATGTIADVKHIVVLMQENQSFDHYFGTLKGVRGFADGARAAHFAVYANAFRSGGPWQYTVPANGSTTDFFNCGTNFGGGKYDLTVVGPNRFLRRVQGNAGGAGKDVEARSRITVTSSTGKLALWLDLANGSGAAVTCTVTSNNYRTDGPWTYQVPAGQTVSDYFDAVAYTSGWYDFTVTVSADSAWSRRFSGHIETGAASVTG